nr:hypothetical protein [Tanacetum cinerariifolium]
MRQETRKMDQRMKKTQILTRLYDVTPTIVLRLNLFKARHVIQQQNGVTTCKIYVVTLLLWKAESSKLHYGITWTLDYTITSFKLARWKIHVSSLRGFASIAGGLDHVNPVIRLPIEHGINMVLGGFEIARIIEQTKDIYSGLLTLETTNETMV